MQFETQFIVPWEIHVFYFSTEFFDLFTWNLMNYKLCIFCCLLCATESNVETLNDEFVSFVLKDFA